MHKSEVAHLMQRIEEECQAMQRAMTGYAITSPHAFIHSRYLSIGALQQRLAELVGEQEAAEKTYETYAKVIG